MEVEQRWFSVSYLDASAAVKLVVQEPGSENLLRYFHPPTGGPRGGFHITSLCLAEALGVLKRKWLRRQLSDKEYHGKCFLLVNYCSRRRIRLEDTEIESSTFLKATKLASKHKLDVSDALQLLTVKHGKFRHNVEESKTLLITADRKLAAAAKVEGLRVWNCQTKPTPPPK